MVMVVSEDITTIATILRSSSLPVPLSSASNCRPSVLRKASQSDFNFVWRSLGCNLKIELIEGCHLGTHRGYLVSYDVISFMFMFDKTSM